MKLNYLINKPIQLKTSLFKSNYFIRDFIFTWSLNPNKKSVHILLPSQTNLIIPSNTFTNIPFSPNRSTSWQEWSFTTFLLNNSFFINLEIFLKKSFGFSFYYIQGFIFVLFIDACLTDDEPLWEPIEWSLVQTWILFIFSFAWIAENLIVSRYGSYTGRDKRVWMSWYKTFWLIEGYYIINYAVAAIFVIVPFYFETNYNLSFVYSWWHWYSRVFFLNSFLS